VIATENGAPDHSAGDRRTVRHPPPLHRAEAAQLLNIKDTWLKRWVTARWIPHQRIAGPDGKQQRGVWFTWADILAIGDMLPKLMTAGQAKKAAAVAADPADLGAPEPVSAAVVEEWATLGLRWVRQQDELVGTRRYKVCHGRPGQSL
jgi:hypothetical protein